MPRPSNSAQRRAQIVAGLEQVMATHGYERATVGAIAQAAGLAAGLVHYHFETKQEILVELVRALADRLAERCEQAMRRETTARGRLAAWLDAHVARGPGADPRAVACWVAIGAEALRQPEVQAVYADALRRQMDALCDLLADAAAPRRLTAARRKAVAAGLLAAIEGAWLLGTATPQVAPRGFASPALRAMLDGFLEEVKQ